MQANGGPAQPAAPVTVTGSFGISPDVTVPEIAPPSSLYIKTLYQGIGSEGDAPRPQSARFRRRCEGLGDP
jgi:hypothetical protein